MDSGDLERIRKGTPRPLFTSVLANTSLVKALSLVFRHEQVLACTSVDRGTSIRNTRATIHRNPQRQLSTIVGKA